MTPQALILALFLLGFFASWKARQRLLDRPTFGAWVLLAIAAALLAGGLLLLAVAMAWLTWNP